MVSRHEILSPYYHLITKLHFRRMVMDQLPFAQAKMILDFIYARKTLTQISDEMGYSSSSGASYLFHQGMSNLTEIARQKL